jgi:hypothetical protein
MLRHRMISRNAASSRAIPIAKMLAAVQDDPVMPVWWGKNQAGMVAEGELEGQEKREAELEWLLARDHAVTRVKALQQIGLHKAISNRLLEPWMWSTEIITATEWSNMFGLRCHPHAQPECRVICEMIRDAMAASKPEVLDNGDWHLPLLPDLQELADAGLSTRDLIRVATGRCARVSYLTHDGKRDPQADIDLHDRLLASGHLSPFEHCARAERSPLGWSGNFFGWTQYRKTLSPEHCEADFSARPRS